MKTILFRWLIKWDQWLLNRLIADAQRSIEISFKGKTAEVKENREKMKKIYIDYISSF